MPTHRGKTQTDILIGGGGDSGEQHTEFEFDSIYSTVATLDYADLAPGSDRQSAGYQLILRDSAGSVLATFAARYKAWVDRGSATGPKTIDIQNSFTPAPSGSNPGWPLYGSTTADRSWKVDLFDSAGGLYARQSANWQLRSEILSRTGKVIQTVTDQTADLLRVQLVYMEGMSVLLTVTSVMIASSTHTGSVTGDPPDVHDRFTP